MTLENQTGLYQDLENTLGQNLFSRGGILIQSEVIQQAILSTQEKMFSRGKEDGALGINASEQQVDNLAETFADQLSEDALIKLTAEYEKAKHSTDQKKERKELAKGELVKRERHIAFLNYVRLFDPRSYSPGLAWIYIVVGLVLVFADLPLAYKLITQGFGFNADKESYEILLTALGVSCCTIFIKIMYDEFIGPSFGSPVIGEKYFLSLFDANPEQALTLTDAERKRIRNWKYCRYGIKIAIFVLTIFVIGWLGKFRSVTLNKMDSREQIDSRTKAAMKQPVNLFDTAASQVDSVQQKNEAIEKQATEDQKNVNTPTFILLTLLFPLISGVCFSLGFNFRQNIRAYKDALADLVTAKVGYADCEKEFEDALLISEGWNTGQSQFNSPTWKSNFVKRLSILYGYGKTIGRTRPDLMNSIPDLLTIVERWRDKKIYFTTNQLIQNS